jgi:hypothetical protein
MRRREVNWVHFTFSMIGFNVRAWPCQGDPVVQPAPAPPITDATHPVRPQRRILTLFLTGSV